jgi:hypothetical protein
MNVHYAAYSYLDEYWTVDEPTMGALRLAYEFGSRDEHKRKNAREALCNFAHHYAVIRTLRDRGPQEPERLRGALDILCGVPDLTTESEAVVAVEKFAGELGNLYGGKPLSAATKFMWLRFPRRVIIYDSLAWKWLRKHSDLRDGDNYQTYTRLWRASFERHAGDIGLACDELIGIKRFTKAVDIPDEDLSALLSADWFRERVFDHAIIEDSEL